MSRTVSFRASEDLDDFLEREAERRMTTKSTVANMLIAERVRQIRGETASTTSPPESATSPTDREDETTDSDDGEVGDGDDLPPEFEKHRTRWYRPNSSKGYKFAVRMPDGESTKYYKTAGHAADRLDREYGDG